MKNNFKKFAVAIAAIMTIGSVTLVSCDKENDEEPVVSQEINAAKLSGTSWTYHYEGTIEYGEYSIATETDYTLTFSTATDGTERVNATSTIAGNSESSSTDWQFNYTFDGTHNGTIHFIIPDDTPSYVRDNMPEVQNFVYNDASQTITIILESGEMVFTKQ